MSFVSDEDITTGGNRQIQLQHQVPNPSNELVLEPGRYLPSDTVTEILSRLPVKTLFRFRSACTNWNANITTSRHLASMHQRNYTKASLLLTYNDLRHDTSSVLLHPDGDVVPRPIDLDNHLLDDVICGAGHLFLLGKTCRHHRPDYRLLNLATRQIRAIPNPIPGVLETPPVVGIYHDSDFCGVGPDLAADDVKVVLVRDCFLCRDNDNRNRRSSVLVYTLRSDCWRELQAVSCPKVPCGEKRFGHPIGRHVFSNGFFYWLFPDGRGPGDNNYVVAFDMGRDVFHEIDCPVDAPPGGGVILGTWRDSVALIRAEMYSPNDMWLLSNGGGGGGEWCWTKRRSSRGPFPRRVNAHGWWDDDQILVDVECWELLLCDTVAEECRVLMMDKSPQRVHVYRESLSLQLTTN